MNNRKGRSASRSSNGTSDFAFWIISLMHDNPLLPMFRNPYRLLEAAGLKQRQKVLEVGCGPGYFTIPAAKMVGHEGFVYAVDVHPRAMERVRRKTEREGMKNVVPILANASRTGLPDHSIDLAFVFGLRHIAGGLEDLAAELAALCTELAQYPEPDPVADVALRVLQADAPKLRYLAPSDPRQAGFVAQNILRDLAYLSSGDSYQYSRDELIAMLDEALADSAHAKDD